MFSVITSQSEDTEASYAANEIINDCQKKLDGRTPSAGILFASIDLDHQEILNELKRAWPTIELIGCSTDGEFSNDLGFREDSAVLTLFVSDSIEISVGMSGPITNDIPTTCKAAIDQARTKTNKPPTLCIALPNPLGVSMDNVVTALQQELGDDVVIVGGAPADQWRFKATYQFCGERIDSDSVAVMLFSGPLVYSTGVMSGWDPVGRPVQVTRSKDNVVYELGGRTAQQFYQDHLGSEPKPIGENPIAILDENGETSFIRTSIDLVHDESGSITYLGNVPEGSMIQLCTVSRESVLNGCGNSLRHAYATYPDGKQPAAALCFSCAARHLMLGTKTCDEFEMVNNYTEGTIPIAGFYTYGEIAPANQDKTTNSHNQTFVTLLLGD